MIFIFGGLKNKILSDEMEPIVYHLFPVRLYPSLVSQIRDVMGFSYEYHDPIKCKDPTDSILLYDGPHLPTRADYDPMTVFATKETNGIGSGSSQIDFLYGPFSKEKLLYDSRQRFTIIQNPVDHIYEFYRYLHGAFLERTANEPRGKRIVEMFEDVLLKPLDSYIDTILQTDGVMKNDQYEFIPELTRLTNFPSYDYVGTVEKPNETIGNLSDFLNVPIEVEPSMNYVPIEKTYRRKDLEKMMEEDMEIWLQYNL